MFEQIYIYTNYIRSQNTALCARLQDSSARHYQTPLDIQIFRIAKTYRPINGQ